VLSFEPFEQIHPALARPIQGAGFSTIRMDQDSVDFQKKRIHTGAAPTSAQIPRKLPSDSETQQEFEQFRRRVTRVKPEILVDG
jgi:hypothetical protein